METFIKTVTEIEPKWFRSSFTLGNMLGRSRSGASPRKSSTGLVAHIQSTFGAKDKDSLNKYGSIRDMKEKNGASSDGQDGDKGADELSPSSPPESSEISEKFKALAAEKYVCRSELSLKYVCAAC